MNQLTPTLLSAAMPGCPIGRAQIWAPHLDAATALFDIRSRARLADFLAQIGHESLGLYYSREIWGPTAQQTRYERDFSHPWTATNTRNSLAFGLGNNQVGDGKRYAGHGPIQVTGRANHAQAFADLVLFRADVPDFEEFPDLLVLPQWGALAAGNFWRRKGLNAFADNGDFVTQTKRINGGTNGLLDRQSRRFTARQVLESWGWA